MSAEKSEWAIGYTLFASVMLLVIGTFHIVAGIAGIVEDDFYVVGVKWVFELDATAWGWIHLIGGIIVFASGIGVLIGNVAARTIGVIVAAVSAIANFVWLPYYPVWSVVMIALDVAVIWALSVHGRDLASTLDR